MSTELITIHYWSRLQMVLLTKITIFIDTFEISLEHSFQSCIFKLFNCLLKRLHAHTNTHTHGVSPSILRPKNYLTRNWRYGMWVRDAFVPVEIQNQSYYHSQHLWRYSWDQLQVFVFVISMHTSVTTETFFDASTDIARAT